ncbi:hypothetical protein HK096_001444 [Nowakowskiella sp. JEL0078]|nr:hypothetical protein HK096_001444 [Nowakowskiella sp. JEL0078]
MLEDDAETLAELFSDKLQISQRNSLVSALSISLDSFNDSLCEASAPLSTSVSLAKSTSQSSWLSMATTANNNAAPDGHMQRKSSACLSSLSSEEKPSLQSGLPPQSIPKNEFSPEYLSKPPLSSTKESDLHNTLLRPIFNIPYKFSDISFNSQMDTSSFLFSPPPINTTLLESSFFNLKPGRRKSINSASQDTLFSASPGKQDDSVLNFDWLSKHERRESIKLFDEIEANGAIPSIEDENIDYSLFQDKFASPEPESDESILDISPFAKPCGLLREQRLFGASSPMGNRRKSNSEMSTPGLVNSSLAPSRIAKSSLQTKPEKSGLSSRLASVAPSSHQPSLAVSSGSKISGLEQTHYKIFTGQNDNPPRVKSPFSHIKIPASTLVNLKSELQIPKTSPLKLASQNTANAKSDLTNARPSMIKSKSKISKVTTPTKMDPEKAKATTATTESESVEKTPSKSEFQSMLAPLGPIGLQSTSPLKFSSPKNESHLKSSTLKGDSQIAKKASPKVDMQNVSALSKLRAPSRTGNVFKKTNIQTDISLNQLRAKDQLAKSEHIHQKQPEPQIHSQSGANQLKYSPRKTSLPKPSQTIVEKRSPEKIEQSLLPKSKMPKTSSGLPTRYPASRTETRTKVEPRSVSGSFRTQVHTSRLQSLKKNRTPAFKQQCVTQTSTQRHLHRMSTEDKLAQLIQRLEAATSRLEHVASAKVAATPKEAAAGVSAALAAYKDAIAGPLAAYVALSDRVGGLVQAQAAFVANAFAVLESIIETAAASKKPDISSLQDLLKPLQKALEQIAELRDKNRPSPLFNHLSAVSDGIPALGWVAVEPAPAPYVGELRDSASFYSNRVIKEYKDKDKSHVEWANSFVTLLTELQTYVKKNHTTGLTWNPKGGDVKSFSAAVKATPVPKPEVTSTPASAALFSSLNKDGLTSGLRKVDKSEMTHKNPELRASGVIKVSETSTLSAAGNPKNSKQKPTILC